jgi:hypothetical protein
MYTALVKSLSNSKFVNYIKIKLYKSLFELSGFDVLKSFEKNELPVTSHVSQWSCLLERYRSCLRNKPGQSMVMFVREVSIVMFVRELSNLSLSLRFYE